MRTVNVVQSAAAESKRSAVVHGDPSGNKTEVLSVRVPAEMAEQLRQKANRKDEHGDTVTLSRVVTEALQRGF